MKKMLFLFLALGCFFTNTSIRAQSGFALGIRGGQSILTAKVFFYDTPEGGNYQHLAYSGNSPEIGFAIEYNFSKICFLRLGGFSSSGDYTKTNTNQNQNVSPTSVSITMPGIDFDIGVDIPLMDSTISFLGNVGLAFQDFHITSSYESIEDSWGGAETIFNMGIGLKGHLSSNFFLEIEYRYIVGLGMSTNQTPYMGWDVSMDGSRILLGIYYKL